MAKDRQSNFELLRILAIFLILLYHANTFSLGECTRDDCVNDPAGSMIRLFWNSLCCIGVNLFVMISGWFGIKPTLKGAFSLLFQVWFYCSLILCVFWGLGIPVETKWILKMFFFGSAYWFINEYLVLYVFSPVLNAFINNSSVILVKNVLIAFFILEIGLGWMIQFSGFGGGYYAIHFFGLYLLMRYVRLYGGKIKALPKWSYLVIYLACSIIPALGAFYGRVYFNYGFGQVHYSSPFVILAALAIFLLFLRLEFKNKTINWLAASALAIYLVHVNPIVIPYYKGMILNIYNNTNEFHFFIAAFFVSFIIGILCMVFDKIRILIWNKFCEIFLDRLFCKVEQRFQ